MRAVLFPTRRKIGATRLCRGSVDGAVSDLPWAQARHEAGSSYRYLPFSSQLGEVLVPAGSEFTEEVARMIANSELDEIEVIREVEDPLILNTIQEDTTVSHEDALLRIYGRLRPGNPPHLEKAKQLFVERFFDPNRYRLGKVGRFRINRKFHQDLPESAMTLRVEDVLNSLKYLLLLRSGGEFVAGRKYSETVQVLLIEAGVPEAERARAIWGKIKLLPLSPYRWRRRHGFLAPAGVFGRLHRLKAAAKLGDYEEIVRMIREFWAPQTLEEPGTLWEMSDGSASRNHGFGSACAALLMQEILGIKPYVEGGRSSGESA